MYAKEIASILVSILKETLTKAKTSVRIVAKSSSQLIYWPLNLQTGLKQTKKCGKQNYVFSAGDKCNICNMQGSDDSQISTICSNITSLLYEAKYVINNIRIFLELYIISF